MPQTKTFFTSAPPYLTEFFLFCRLLFLPSEDAKSSSPSIFQPRIPGGKTSGGRDHRTLGFDATAPPLAYTLPTDADGRTAGRGRTPAIHSSTPAGDFAMAAAPSTASTTAATSSSAATAAAATASSKMLSQLKKKLSRFTISRDEGPVCDSGIYCYGE